MVETYSHIHAANSSLTTAFLEVLFETNTTLQAHYQSAKEAAIFLSHSLQAQETAPKSTRLAANILDVHECLPESFVGSRINESRST